MIKYKRIVMILALLVIAAFFPFIEASIISQMNKTENSNIQRARGRFDKLNAFFKKYPEYRQFISAPYSPPPTTKTHSFTVKRDDSVDTIRVLVIRAEFQKDTTPMTTGDGTFADTAYGEPYTIDSTSGKTEHNLAYDPPHDSIYFHNQMLALRNYYLSDFDGKLFIEWDQYPKTQFGGYTFPHKMQYYGDLYDVAGGLFKLMEDAVREADNDTSDTIQFGQYDSYIIFHAGSAWQSDMGDSPYDIPAVYIRGFDAIGGRGGDRYMTKDGTNVMDAIIYPETARQDGDTLSGLQGGLAHEFGHQLGMIDLYDISYETMGCGGWALMGTGNWNVNGLIPPHHMAWHSSFPVYVHPHTNPSYRRVFIEPVTIDHDTTGLRIQRRGGNEDSIPKIYKIPINSHEYYIIANRIAYISPDTISSNPDSNGLRIWKDGVLIKINDYDQGLPSDYGRGGLAIWHIDENVIDSMIDMNAVNGGAIHGIKMIEADGIQDFQRPVWNIFGSIENNAAFYGTPYDLYFSGNNDSLTQYSTPKSIDNNNGYTRVNIKNVSIDRNIMTFDVSFNWKQKGFPVQLDTVTDVNSPLVYDLDGDGINEILQNGVAGEIYIFEPDGTPYMNTINGLATRMSGNEAYTGNAIGDITGDGRLEIVSTSTDGKLYAYHADSLSLVPVLRRVAGFPFATGEMILGAPLLADIDDDSTDEIIFGSNNNYLYCLNYNGSIPEIKWKVYMTQWLWGTPIYYNGFIYALSGDGRLFKIKAENGDTVWTKGESSIWQTTSSPVMGNIQNIDTMAIFYTNANNEMILVDEFGNVKWKKEIKDTVNYQTFYSTPAIGDINRDNKPEIIFTAGGKVFAVHSNGTMMSGFPVEIDTEVIQSSIVLGDIDGDDTIDIVVAAPCGNVHAINYHGKNVSNFPMSLGSKCFSTPVLADIDGDRDMELLVGDEGNQLNVFDLSVIFDSSNVTSPFQHKNIKHNALYIFSYDNNASNDSLPILKENSFYIYPNPVTRDNLKIRLTLNHIAYIKYIVFDASKNVRQKGDIYINDINIPSEFPIETDMLGNDLYIIQIELYAGDKVEKYYKKLLIAR